MRDRFDRYNMNMELAAGPRLAAARADSPRYGMAKTGMMMGLAPSSFDPSPTRAR